MTHANATDDLNDCHHAPFSTTTAAGDAESADRSNGNEYKTPTVGRVKAPDADTGSL